MTNILNKVLVLGSGPIIIGQAAEFDYAGTQACKSLREEGITTVLVNSNPATIMTDDDIADHVYIEPLTTEVLERIIEKENPDGILPTLGGQTALNLAIELAEKGILEKFEVKLLGSKISAIKSAEDRQLFRDVLTHIGEPALPSEVANTLAGALSAKSRIGLPLVVRPAYTLGGTGGGIANDEKEFIDIVTGGLDRSPISQVLIEKSIAGWKELEYEVMRDSADNCITICNMENIDPMGVHTGDSIVVAPSQTLSDKDYQMLRIASLKIIRALSIEGGCNVQFALYPGEIVQESLPHQEQESKYYVIEVNPRVSRSSALASKATGYPIARVAAKIAVGRTLDEIPNAITGKTLAAFEPALDYCVVKIPRWPFDKFPDGDRTLGTQMKATGEVMAIDRTFESAFQKAIRSLEITGRSILWEDPSWIMKSNTVLGSLPIGPNGDRIWAILAALRRKVSPEEISRRTGIDPWFTRAFSRIISMEHRLSTNPLDSNLMWDAKRLGFPDDIIAHITKHTKEDVRKLRQSYGFKPVFKMVDTCAGEFEAQTPYFYSTYEEENEALPIKGPKSVVLGSGPIRIGQGIEFDYCSVHAAWALEEEGIASIMINSNPETVSTDFDTSNRLYFEPLDEESVRDILENESLISDDGQSNIPASIVQFGGQTAINLSQILDAANLPILGSTAKSIDTASDRHLFERFLSKIKIPNPPGSSVATESRALEVADDIGYPVLVRPSYVLGGRGMEIVQTPQELRKYMANAFEAGGGRKVLIDKYFEGREVEVDAVCDGENVLIPGIMEHVERAGVHSGDSMAVYPEFSLSNSEVSRIVDYTTRIGRALQIKGLMNIQYVVVGGDTYRSPSTSVSTSDATEVFVIEVNPRSSRTIPFISKITGVPMVKLAVKAMLGMNLQNLGYRGGLWEKQNLVGVKVPVFSMSKLAGVDTFLGPEMKSTGEVMGIDKNFESATTKALIAADIMLPSDGSILLSISDEDKNSSSQMIKNLGNCGYKFFATEGTAAFINGLGYPVIEVPKRLNDNHPNVVDIINNGTVDAVVNTVTRDRDVQQDGFYIRRAAVDGRIPCFTSLDTARSAVESLLNGGHSYNVLTVKEYFENT